LPFNARFRRRRLSQLVLFPESAIDVGRRPVLQRSADRREARAWAIGALARGPAARGSKVDRTSGRLDKYIS
jgi:hypothetical protein